MSGRIIHVTPETWPWFFGDKGKEKQCPACGYVGQVAGVRHHKDAVKCTACGFIFKKTQGQIDRP